MKDEDLAFLRDVKGGHRVVPELESLRNLIKDKVGFVFTDVPVFKLKPIIEANKVSAVAKVGVVSIIDVIIPPGPTGMDPSAISFFHAL
jgi:large subunit ribosomal protein LP0